MFLNHSSSFEIFAFFDAYAKYLSAVLFTVHIIGYKTLFLNLLYKIPRIFSCQIMITFIALKSVTMLDSRFLISNSKNTRVKQNIFYSEKITQSAWLFLIKIFQDEPGAVMCILWLWRLPSSVFVYSKVQCTDCIRDWRQDCCPVTGLLSYMPVFGRET